MRKLFKSKSRKTIVTLLFFIFILFYFCTIAYSAFSSTMNIDGVGYSRVETNVRITDFSINEVLNATSMYEDFGKDYIISEISLSPNSSITYNLEITNYGSSNVGIYSIIGLPENVYYSIEDYNLKDKICDDSGKCNTIAVKTYLLKIYTTDYSYKGILKLDFDFQQFYSITYKNLNGIYPTEIISGDSIEIDLSSESPLYITVDDEYVDSFSYINNILKINNIKNNIKVVAITKLDYEFGYTGNYQEFEIPLSGIYKIELWGAQGGNSISSVGGLGGATSGDIYMNKGEKLYLYIGSQPTTQTGGYNGGGDAGTLYNARGGGGATDIRYFGNTALFEEDLKWDSALGLNSRIMVAGAGGGADSYDSQSDGGHGGTLVAGAGVSSNYDIPLGGTQVSGGISGYGSVLTENGSFGIGGSGITNQHGSGGGGGYYGGGAGNYNGGTRGPGTGGSSFISGYAGTNAISSSTDISEPRIPSNNTIHYSGKYFFNGNMEIGVNNGHGKAIITYLGENKEKTNSNLNNVRYIKNCINGSNVNGYNHWVELQAIHNGKNVAYEKTIISKPNIVGSHSDYLPIDSLLDANINSNKYINSSNGEQCVVVDLTETYNLEEIAVWHFYLDSRSYNNHNLFVSADNTIWTTLINDQSGIPQTSNGIKYKSTYN